MLVAACGFAGCGAEPGDPTPQTNPLVPGAPPAIVGPPADEVCDGMDNDHDGEVDEDDPSYGLACDTGQAGICAAGTLVCGTYAELECVPDQAPLVEDCGTPEDEDCDGFGGCPGGTHVWSRGVLDAGGQSFGPVATDASNNIFVGASANGNVDFGSGPIPITGGMAVVKYGAAGSAAWAKPLCPNVGGASGGTIYAVATDAAGNVFAAGIFSGTCDFGTGPLSVAGLGSFLVKLDPSGTTLWARSFAGGSYGSSVAADAAGNVYYAGYSTAPFDFGAGPLAGADEDVVLGKFDAAGNLVWGKRFVATKSQRLPVIDVDAGGDVVLGFLYNSSADVGTGPLPGTGVEILLAEIDPSGNTIWAKNLGGQYDQILSSLRVDPSGDLLLGGHFYYRANFGGPTLNGIDAFDGFVAKLGPTGNHVWTKRLGGPNYQEQVQLDVDAAGNISVAGHYQGSVDLGLGSVPGSSTSTYDIFAAKLGPSGATLWAGHFGDAGDQRFGGLAVDTAGNTILAGVLYGGSIDFGGGALNANLTSGDAFLAKLSP
ncbi:SBBP repeat-containing protein [Polyangium sp. 6x1]|uniref:SBBP repeat-containing protein n=1 Tax=Polyangium sp. 6x1 TaxID=3042689 RepID=UPI0024824201|nr:SBBP repeat-containing protein [Polyangium sp. 6x1]MDI1445064.1 hypothetical protein [Polyangium sp. 6x1]